MRRWPLQSCACAAAVALAAATLAGCGGDSHSAGSFCNELSANQASLTAPIATPDDIAATLDLYRRLAETTPLAIEEEWAKLVTSLETADTVDPTDPDSVQRAADTAYATQEPAQRVAEWARATCALEIGPVGTVSPPPPSTTSTIPDDEG